MSEDAPSRPAGNQVDRDVACLGCSYNLHGLPAGGNCPECGWTVMRSLRGNLLRYADERWVRHMRRGVSTVYTSILVVLLVVTAGLMLFGVLVIVDPLGRGEDAYTWSALAAAFALCAIPVMYPIAWWLATAPDPGECVDAAWPRRTLRVTAVLLFPVYALWIGGVPWLWAGSPVAIEVISHLCFAAIWLHLVMMTGVLDQLHLRTAAISEDDDRRDRKRMRKAVRWAQRAPVIFLAIHWVYGLLEIAISRKTGALPFRGLGTGVGPVLITLLWLSTIDACRIVARAARNEQLLAAATGDSSG